jgi:hypothetical protein
MHESGPSATRQMKRSTFAPRRRLSMNHTLSATRQAAKPVKTIQ